MYKIYAHSSLKTSDILMLIGTYVHVTNLNCYYKIFLGRINFVFARKWTLKFPGENQVPVMKMQKQTTMITGQQSYNEVSNY